MIIPNHLEWVYIYAGKNTGKVPYIGRASNAANCRARIQAHLKEEWHKEDEWSLLFRPCVNRAESEAIETEYINRLHPYGNKDKIDWGEYLDITLNDEYQVMIRVDEYDLSSINEVKVILEDAEKRIIEHMEATQ